MASAVVLACAGFIAASGPVPSNIAPLSFGMTVEEAENALGVPLEYVSGKPGSEVFVAVRRTGPRVLYPMKAEVYLQFRRGCLTGFKPHRHIKRHWLF